MGKTRWLKYWERNGTRRPFPSLYEAVNAYGVDNVSFDAPKYEKQNQCPWCGGEVNNKRRRFCCNQCREKFNLATVWQRKRDAYSLRILYRDKFTCQDCGEENCVINEHGMKIPADNGNLQVHHIKPVSQGGGDEPANLITLCKKCHLKRHGKGQKLL